MESIQKPKAIMFDLGNTLLKETFYDFEQGMTQTLIDLNIYYNATCFNDPHYLKQRISDFHANYDNEFLLIDWLKNFLKDFGVNREIEKVEQMLWNNTVVLEPYPDNNINSILYQLKQQGIKLSIVSNSIFRSDFIKYELSKHHLLDYFDFVMTSGEVGVRKPAKQIFLKAVDAIKLHPADIWFVGDNWETDIMGAASAGLKPVWKCESGKPQNCVHLYFHDWQDFIDRFIKN